MEKKILIYFLTITLTLSGVIAYVVSRQNNDGKRFGVVTSTGNFPTSLNNFQDDDIINSGDWNHIEYAIGETGTTSSATLTYNVFNTNANNLAYTGKLTITTASTTNFSVPSSGYFNLNATGTMQGFAFCTSGNGACGSGLTIGGSDTQVQFNDSGVLGGDADFVWNKTLNKLTATNGSFTNATTTGSLFIPTLAGLTITATGQVGIDTTTNNLKFRSGGYTQVLTATSSFSFAIASTTASEFIPLKTFDQAATIQKLSCVNSDIGSPSVTFNLAHGTDSRSTVTSFAPSLTNTSTTTPTDYYGTFNDITLAAGEILVATSSASTATGFFNCTLYYKWDN